VQSGALQSGVVQSGVVQSGALQSGVAQSGVAQSGVAQSGALQAVSREAVSVGNVAALSPLALPVAGANRCPGSRHHDGLGPAPAPCRSAPPGPERRPPPARVFPVRRPVAAAVDRYHRAMATDPGDAYDLDLASASLQSAATDLGMLLRLLVSQLSDTLGPRLHVERAGGLLRKSHEIKSLEVTMGDDVLRAETDHGELRCTVAHSSGGIRIRSDKVTVDEWLKRLLELVQVEAAHSERARQALENIVIGGNP
jgi:hypothetical protein